MKELTTHSPRTTAQRPDLISSVAARDLAFCADVLPGDRLVPGVRSGR